MDEELPRGNATANSIIIIPLLLLLSLLSAPELVELKGGDFFLSLRTGITCTVACKP